MMSRAAELRMSCASMLATVLLLPNVALSLPASVPSGSDAIRLERRLQTTLDVASFTGGGLGLSLGVAWSGGTLALGSGLRDLALPRERNLVEPRDRFALGSTTKMYTAAAVMRLVDAGRIRLDEPALPLLDGLFRNLTGSSAQPWLRPDVTVRHLLGMQSGIPDFDNAKSRKYQFEHPQDDIGPVQSIRFVPQQNWVCEPGTCVAYSSTNYEFLGLLLAQQAGAASWDAYDQASGLPKDVLSEMPGTTFPLHGTCSTHGVVHGYHSFLMFGSDVYNMSCLNGWTCGNVISPASDAAVFVRALLGPGQRVVSTKALQEMLPMKPFTTGWGAHTKLRYGLGLMDVSTEVGHQNGTFIGHGGETNGFNACTGYLRHLDVGISVAANTENIILIMELCKHIVNSVEQDFATPMYV